MFDEAYKIALENRVSRLAAECLGSLTDEQETRLRTEMMKGLQELSDRFSSVRIVYVDKNVHKVVELGYKERFANGIDAMLREVQKLDDLALGEDHLKVFQKLYSILDMMHDLVDRRI
jgi:hypothetical protein